MTAFIDLRDADAALTAAVLALNADHADQTSPLDAAALSRLVGEAALALAAPGGEAFLLALDERADYASPNFRWFRARHARFLYVDRVVVAARARGRGLARALDAAASAKARAIGAPMLCCEVNLSPPNPVSDAFHAALGFTERGRAVSPESGRTVRYLARDVEADG